MVLMEQNTVEACSTVLHVCGAHRLLQMEYKKALGGLVQYPCNIRVTGVN